MAADTYGSNTRHQICLNYSNALRWKEQPRQALKILTSALRDFQNLPDAHIYHTQLAILYDELGPKQLAERHWQLAYESALRIGDSEAIALSSGALAEAHDDSGEFEKADGHYRTALKHEDDDSLKLRLLLERMGVLLQLKKEKEASTVFEEIRRISSKQKSNEEYIDALVMLGDYNWTDGEAPKEALKAYVAAMAACGSDDIQRYFELGAMTAVRLLQTRGRSKPIKIRSLLDSTVHWLRHDQNLEAEKQNGQLLLWPFQAALRLVGANRTRGVPHEREFTKVLMEEFEKATA